MKKLIFATHNPGKLQEMQEILAGLRIEVVSAEQAGVTEDVEEDQETFVGNALKKARFVAEVTGEWAVADDSGITIDVLDGRPGVYTARWAGEGASDQTLIQHTLSALESVPEGKRQASFHTVAALVGPEGQERTFKGVIMGHIPLKPRGEHRPKLPYDVIFIPEGHTRTFAEMSAEEKNTLSHRGQAFRALQQFIETKKDG